MAKATAGGDENGADLGFEQAVARLEKLVDRLEAGHLSLEDSLRDYEQGMQLVARCRTELDRAEQRVRELRESAAADAAPTTGG